MYYLIFKKRTGDIDIIEKITLLKWKEYVQMFSSPGGVLDEFTKEVPNLHMKLKLRLKTTSMYT